MKPTFVQLSLYYAPMPFLILSLVACVIFFVFVAVAFHQKRANRKLYVFLISRTIGDALGVLLYIIDKVFRRLVVKMDWRYGLMVFATFYRTAYHGILLGTNIGLTGCKCVAVMKPLFYRRYVELRHTCVAVGVVWLLSVFLAAPPTYIAYRATFAWPNGSNSSESWFELYDWAQTMPKFYYVVFYLLNVFGSGALLMALHRNVVNSQIRKQYSREANRSFSAVATEWSVLNYAILQLPTFLWFMLFIFRRISPENEILKKIMNHDSGGYLIGMICDVAAAWRMSIDAILPVLSGEDAHRRETRRTSHYQPSSIALTTSDRRATAVIDPDLWRNELAEIRRDSIRRSVVTFDETSAPLRFHSERHRAHTAENSAGGDRLWLTKDVGNQLELTESLHGAINSSGACGRKGKSLDQRL